ncbi:hypothetical protein GMLC_33020 [Geomonas limicola]|uniref:Uncharacterized protein n=1 Tax=Geomonas limicola TaxID=2740186 RepID=A0A6V8NDT0_9BACT|nr:hypothetical protein [Geomonas limicola]GFO69723.1 hypothetical protein GMLC_33020 [Geomonas limicola]
MRITASYNDLTCDITRNHTSEGLAARSLADFTTLAAWSTPKPCLYAATASACARSTPHPRRYSR